METEVEQSHVNLDTEALGIGHTVYFHRDDIIMQRKILIYPYIDIYSFR